MTRALARQPIDDEKQFLAGTSGFVLSVNGLSVVKGRRPPFNEWDELGARLAVLDRGIQFIVGDWLNQVEAEFGEEASQAVDASRWSEESRKVFQWVARQVPAEVRVMHLDGMTFRHHMVVARLMPKAQSKWLKLAARGDGEGQPWSVARLQAALAAGEDLPVVGWRLLVTCDSAAERQRLRDRLEGQGLACKDVDQRRKGGAK